MIIYKVVEIFILHHRVVRETEQEKCKSLEISFFVIKKGVGLDAAVGGATPPWAGLLLHGHVGEDGVLLSDGRQLLQELGVEDGGEHVLVGQ